LPTEEEMAQPEPANPLRVENPVPSDIPPEPAVRPDDSRAPPNARTATPAPPRHNAGIAPPLHASTRPTPPPPPGNKSAPQSEIPPQPPVIAAWPVLQREAVTLPPSAAFKGLPRAGDDSKLPPASMPKDRRLDPDWSGLPAASVPRESMQVAALEG